jgi:peptidoglycan/xylan/chitin deacetylase (PgdA/CDA1 family)
MRGILTYHSIDPSGSPISVDEEAFRRHVDWLASGAVRVVPLERILDVPDEEDAVAITFDDGFTNLADLAWPLLLERELPATLFVPTGRVGHDNSWGDVSQGGIPTLPLCDWDTLARMSAEGLGIGSHTVNHTHLEHLPERELRAELEESTAEIERRLDVRPATFCYPYGTYDDRCVKAAAELYGLSVTTELRTLAYHEHPHRLPRLDAYYFRANHLLEDWGSPAFRGHLWVRATARRARAALTG